MISVTLIGAGNVATHLFHAFNKADNITVNQWFNRDKKVIQQYQNDVDLADNISDIRPSNVNVIAISDDAIKEFSTSLPFEGNLVVHTSGSLGIHDLDRKNRRGVFYPLQTFSKEVDIGFENVPLCLESIEKTDLPLLKSLADAIGSPHYKINSEQRQTLHLAAVFVNNFSNQLYRVAHEITDIKNINFDVLKPLILETANKVQSISPYLAQTGPAKRRDNKTIKKHLKQLDSETHKAIYELLTQSIKETHGR
jgi:predicted short-subunit dehydrogenase-like oxidoreductase (DUF2520 family)